MANNRMFLVHRPSGNRVYLGKRMAVGWYDAPPDLGQKIAEMFNVVEHLAPDGAGQDDFVIEMDDEIERIVHTCITSPSYPA